MSIIKRKNQSKCEREKTGDQPRFWRCIKSVEADLIIFFAVALPMRMMTNTTSEKQTS